MLSFLFGSRGLRPDLPSPFGRKFLFCCCITSSLEVMIMLNAFITSSLEVMIMLNAYLPDREATLIKKEYCRCGPHPPQVISSRVRPPLVKGAGRIGPLFPDFRGWPLWFMASIALQGLHKTLHRRLLLAPRCTLRLSHLSVEGNTRGLEIVGQLDM